MANIYDDNSLSIGRTPLVRLNRVTRGAGATVLAKIEGRNPSYSVKCRIGASMVWDAERRGVLGPGKELIEPTSGNTGIALAFVAAARGYPITLTMPESMSVERRKALKALGAKLVLTEAPKGMPGAIAKAEELVAQDPGRYVLLQQFKNPANPRIHEETTGPELWHDTDGQIDVFVSGVGTGGTITGVSRFFKKTKQKAIVSVAVEPTHSPVITQKLAGQPLQPSPHKIQGIGAGFIPDTLDLSLVDRVEQITNEESIEMALRLAREEGILSGISCGAAAAVAVRLARLPEMAGKVIAAVLPDAGERYLSSALFAGLFNDAGLLPSGGGRPNDGAMDDWKLPWAGGCRCGRVRVRVTAPPLVTMACHCTGCQRMTSSAFSLSVLVPADGFAVAEGEPVIGGLRGNHRHFFCPHCKSWLFTRPGGMDHLVNLRPSALDDHAWFVPFIENYTREKLPWASTPAAHSFEGFPDVAQYPALIADFAARGARPGRAATP